MQNDAKDPDDYLEQVPSERKEPLSRLRDVIAINVPEGFEEALSYGMISYVIPHRIYPAGYHANPTEPIPIISLASQKQHIAVYHMGLYAFPEISAWFEAQYARRFASKLDRGRSCIRFRKTSDIPCWTSIIMSKGSERNETGTI